MTKTDLRRATQNLSAHLLEMASDEFGNHGCNDFRLDDFLTREEQIAFVTFFHEWNGDPEEIPASIEQLPYLSDFCAMSACAELLRHSVSAEIDELLDELRA